ncbi:hypothetical protein [Sutterella sp.]|uniref:hypothetical protein n=1 Tax=Sutterella sp. TaxID=1981025 RepID=UPI0026E0D4DF|nr:hypothetical protein [Sutterella sp.]MDO5530944.1 hypothetical protein [Sutterella sp.]
MKKSLLLAATAAAVIVLAGCGTTRPLITSSTYSVNSTPEAVKTAIGRSAIARSFRIVSEKPGVTRLAYPANARAAKYEMIVDVEYTGTTYTVNYVSSYGLDAAPCKNNPSQTCGHRNITRWIANLAKDIRGYLYK